MVEEGHSMYSVSTSQTVDHVYFEGKKVGSVYNVFSDQNIDLGHFLKKVGSVGHFWETVSSAGYNVSSSQNVDCGHFSKMVPSACA